MSIVKSFSFPDGNIRGDTFYIKHGLDNFTVIDCYLKVGNDDNCRLDEIIDEIQTESEGRICRFISTHPDNDHILGLDALDDKWEIINFYAVENCIPSDGNDSSLSRYIELRDKHNFPISKGIRRRWLNESDSTRGGSGIEFLWPITSNQKFMAALEQVSKGGSPNNICCVFTYSLEGGATYMWMGDLETDMQAEFYQQVDIPNVDILFQPHHGRKSGTVPKELMDALNPKLIIVGNAPSKDIDYGDTSMSITQNTAGDIVFVNETGKTHIYTQHNINNPPTCLQKQPGKGDCFDSKNKTWHYCGTLEV